MFWPQHLVTLFLLLLLISSFHVTLRYLTLPSLLAELVHTWMYSFIIYPCIPSFTYLYIPFFISSFIRVFICLFASSLIETFILQCKLPALFNYKCFEPSLNKFILFLHIHLFVIFFYLFIHLSVFHSLIHQTYPSLFQWFLISSCIYLYLITCRSRNRVSHWLASPRFKNISHIKIWHKSHLRKVDHISSISF